MSRALCGLLSRCLQTSASKALHAIPSLAAQRIHQLELGVHRIRYAMNQRQWEPFLLVNSLGIVSGFRTAFSQGLDEHEKEACAHVSL